MPLRKPCGGDDHLRDCLFTVIEVFSMRVLISVIFSTRIDLFKAWAAKEIAGTTRWQNRFSIRWKHNFCITPNFRAKQMPNKLYSITLKFTTIADEGIQRTGTNRPPHMRRSGRRCKMWLNWLSTLVGKDLWGRYSYISTGIKPKGLSRRSISNAPKYIIFGV